jgi:hypothetical protein
MHKVLGTALVLLFATAPSSTNYILRNYDWGSGGTGSSSSTNYKLNGVSGSQSGSLQTSTSYDQPSGHENVQNAAVPVAPTVSNPSNYYDRLKVVLNVGTAPSDTKYLIAVSSDNFVTTYYVQTDNSIATSVSATNYQTYTAWGGASGFTMLGLLPSTTYQVKVKALQGNFSGSGFGPTGSAATVAPSLTLSLTTTLTSSPPFAVNFASLTAGSVVNGDADATIGITSNAVNGGNVYVQSANAGLKSNATSTTIDSATTDLTTAASGYGAQVTATSQVSGGPLTKQSPFNGSSNTVGALTNTLQMILSTNGAIATGSATIRLMAKADAITPSASDYSDTLTFVAAMNY